MVTWQRRSSLRSLRVIGITALGRSSLFSFPLLPGRPRCSSSLAGGPGRSGAGLCRTSPQRRSRKFAGIGFSEIRKDSVAPCAGSRSGPQSDPSEAQRYTHQGLSRGRSVARRVGLRPQQRSGLSAFHTRFCGGQGRPPRILSAARATEHRMSRPPSPGDGWLGPFRAAFAENAPQLEVYFLAPGIGRGGPFPVLK